MSKARMILGIVLVAIIAVIGIGLRSNKSEALKNSQDQEPDIPVEPELVVSRYDKIPVDSVKMTHAMDNNPPVLHSFLFEDGKMIEADIYVAYKKTS